MIRFGLAIAVFLLVGCGGSDKKFEGPHDGPDIACDCETNPRCKSQSCEELETPPETVEQSEDDPPEATPKR